MVKFSIQCQIVFQSVCIILHSHQQCVKIIVSTYLCQNWLCQYLILIILEGVRSVASFWSSLMRNYVTFSCVSCVDILEVSVLVSCPLLVCIFSYCFVGALCKFWIQGFSCDVYLCGGGMCLWRERISQSVAHIFVF